VAHVGQHDGDAGVEEGELAQPMLERAKSNSTILKVLGEGRNVTSVPRFPPASPTTLSGATASPSRIP
jgi:hypothetical protein